MNRDSEPRPVRPGRYQVGDDRVPVHSEADKTSPIIAELRYGDEFILADAGGLSGTGWRSATLQDGTKGYVIDTTSVFRIGTVMRAQDDIEVLEHPEEGSKLTATCHRGDRFTLAGVVSRKGYKWIVVRTASGEVGFVRTGIETAEADSLAKGLAMAGLTNPETPVFQLVSALSWGLCCC